LPRLGALPKPLTLERIEINPAKVFVSGPRSEVRQIKTVETEPIDLRELKGNETKELLLRVPGTQSTLSVNRVAASIELGSVPRERMLDDLAVEIRASADMPVVSLLPTAVTVVVSGPGDAISQLDRTSVIPYVRMRSAPVTGPVSVDVQVELPSGIKLLRVEPRVVQLQREPGVRPPTRSKSAKKSR